MKLADMAARFDSRILEVCNSIEERLVMEHLVVKKLARKYEWEIRVFVPDLSGDDFFWTEIRLNDTGRGEVWFRIVFGLSIVEKDEVVSSQAIDAISLGEPVSRRAIKSLDKQIDLLESTEMVDMIVEKILKAIAHARLAFRDKPREWSPRWEKPSMGAAARGIAPIRINIVDEDGWKWGDISDWASQSAWDDLVNMSDETRKELVQDLIEASMTKKERKAITDEDLETLLKQLEEDWHALEEIKNAIHDAHYYAWEVAYMPEDGDIEEAMKEDQEFWGEDIRPNDYWDLVLNYEGLPHYEGVPGPREWSPRLTETEFWEDLSNRVRFERKPNYYDRYLVFDWGQSKPVKELLEALKEHPEEGSRKEVEQELRDWADTFTSEVLSHLEHRMQNVDTSNRVDFDAQWKRILSDKSRMDGVREELLEFLEMGPREWSPRRGKK